MAEINPVVVPVRLAVEPGAQSAVSALGDAVKRARDTAAGAGSAPAGSIEAGAPAASARSLAQELTRLESSITKLGTNLDRNLDRLVRRLEVIQGGRGRGGGAGGGGGGGGGGAPGPEPGPGPGQRPGMGLGPFAGQLLTGTLGALGLGVGFGTAYSELQRWAMGARSLAEASFLTTLRGGGSPEDEAALRGVLTRPGRGGLVGPEAALRGLSPLVGMGYPARGGELGALGLRLGELGYRIGGSPEAAAGPFAEAYRVLRLPLVEGYLASLTRYAELGNRNTGEQADQFRSLVGLMARQGSYARSGEDLQRLFGIQAALNRMPDDVGKGAQGAQILETFQGAFGRGGIHQATAMRAFTRITGRAMPGGDREMADMVEWMHNPLNAPEIGRQYALDWGPDAASLLAGGYGAQTGMFRRYFHGGGAEPMPPLGLMPGGMGVDSGLGDTPGAREMGITAERERGLGVYGATASTTRFLRGLWASHPEAMMGAVGLGGGTLFRLARTARGRRMLARLVGGGGTRAAMGGAMRFAGPAAAAGFSAYDMMTEGVDPWGLSGAFLGAGAGGMMGGLPGMATGALYGYSAGSALHDLWGGEGKVSPGDPRFDAAASTYGLPPGLLQAIASVESSFNPAAKSPTGVRGLMQITGRTGRAFGLRDEEWWNPGRQIETSAAILRDAYQRTGSWEGAVGAYGDPKDRGYAARVLGRVGQFAQPGAAYADEGAGPGGELHIFVHPDPAHNYQLRVQAPEGVRVTVMP